MQKKFCLLVVAGMFLVASPLMAKAAKQTNLPPQANGNDTASQQATKTEPDPRQILHSMCDFLKSQEQFSYKAEVEDDQVYQGGKKLQYTINMETFVHRPDRLRVNAEGDLVDKQFFFNGQTITLYDKDRNVYGMLDVPPDIESALDKASREFGVRVALTDLASPKLCELLDQKIKHSLYVGMSKVRGIPAHHLSFDGDAVQVQVWIAAGDKPLPVKVVLTHKNEPASPQWAAYLSDWNFSQDLKDNLFAFVPPEGAEQIKFAPPGGSTSKLREGKKAARSKS